MLTLTQIEYLPESNLPRIEYELARSILAGPLDNPATPPHTRRILERAIDLACNGFVSHNGSDAFEVHSQTDPDVWYEIRDAQCSCPSYRDNPAHLGTRPVCKHTLAVSIMKAALGHLLSEHTLPMNGPNIRKTRTYQNSYLLLSNGSTGTHLMNTEARALRVAVQWNNSHGWLPTSAEGYITLYQWLPHALPTPEQKDRYTAVNEHYEQLADRQSAQAAMTAGY